MSTTEELARLLKDMQETQKETQRQLSQLQRDVTAGQSEATKKVVQKLEEEKTAIFKKRGNEIQYRLINCWTTASRTLWMSFRKSPYLKKNLPVDHERKLTQQ